MLIGGYLCRKTLFKTRQEQRHHRFLNLMRNNEGNLIRFSGFWLLKAQKVYTFTQDYNAETWYYKYILYTWNEIGWIFNFSLVSLVSQPEINLTFGSMQETSFILPVRLFCGQT